MKLVQFGAGNIGRSFIAQIFSRAGWEVVFIDIAEALVSLLNERRYYTVVIKREGRPDEPRRIGPVRAVNGRDLAAAAELAATDLASVSVGKAALPKVLPLIAAGLRLRQTRPLDRREDYPSVRPLDIIIAENDREAPALFRSVLQRELGPEYPLDALVGLVETSIGKMVPVMRSADLAADPLILFAEEYETLIVDRRGFRGPIPDIPAIHSVEPAAAYVDRKLFIHNLGHAAAAYLGWAVWGTTQRSVPQTSGQSGGAGKGGANGGAASGMGLTIPEALALPGVEAAVRRAMNEAAAALLREYPRARYPGSYTAEDLAAHIGDLLFRFKNRALGDTVHRVGRDLSRKLARPDRLTGAMLLCAKHGLPFESIAAVYRAAPGFAAPAEDGSLFPADREFRGRYGLAGNAPDSPESPATPDAPGVPVKPGRLERILREVSALDPSRPEDRAVMETVLRGPA